jgi:hypothetical protein
VATVGCFTVMSVTILIVVLVSLNFDRIKSSSLYRGMESRRNLQSEMMEQFPCDHVQVLISKRSTEQEGRTLRVQLLNPVFLSEPEVDQEAKAREAALFALQSFEMADDVGIVRIGVHTGSSGMIKITSARRFTFTTAELLGSEETLEVPAGEPAELPVQ